MIEIVYYVATSLDGYIATADGGVDWLEGFDPPADECDYDEFFAAVDALIMGRRTYEQVRGFGDWPYGDKPCRVISRRPLESDIPGVSVTGAEPDQVAADLEAEGFRRAWMVGGAKIAAAFQTAGLLTEYRVSVIPIILGAGVPLFSPRASRQSLALEAQKSLSNGVVMLRYTSKQIMDSSRTPPYR